MNTQPILILLVQTIVFGQSPHSREPVHFLGQQCHINLGLRSATCPSHARMQTPCSAPDEGTNVRKYQINKVL